MAGNDVKKNIRGNQRDDICDKLPENYFNQISVQNACADPEKNFQWGMGGGGGGPTVHGFLFFFWRGGGLRHIFCNFIM